MKNLQEKHLHPQVEEIKPPFYFFSDTHISSRQGKAQKQRMEKLLKHLKKIKDTGGTLFILGDFFDFWFDCRNYIPETLKPLVGMLSGLRENGIEIHYVGGNHDYWVRGYLTQELGIHFYPDAIAFTYEGTRFYCQHGDEVVYNHAVYPYIRKILRSSSAIALLKLLPVKWIYTLGEGVSHYNRALTRIPRVPEEIVDEMRAFLYEKLKNGYDITISGHIHKPCYETKNGKSMVILGDWIHHCSYGIWDVSGFRLIQE
ncbi:MAG: UDP-2,3-diacylglucosamine diphosphatase [Fidelibacterota bacterium]